MKLTLLTSAMLVCQSLAWEMDPRCDEFVRHLQYGDGETDISEDELTDYSHVFNHNDASDKQHVTQNLRGKTVNQERKLRASFQLKMFWREGICWQSEWTERKWCMSCEGDTCGAGEQLWIEFCDSSKVVQKFDFIPVNGTTVGKIKTVSADLCLERINDEEIRLNSCASVSDKQSFTAFQRGDIFELSPLGHRHQCLVNKKHHPKQREVIYVTSCKIARTYRTSAWVAFLGDDTSNPGTASELTNLKLRSGSVCSSNQPCDICEGECQNDMDCKGEAQCLQRSGSEHVPDCFGHGTDGKNYCHKPSSDVTVAATTPPPAVTSGTITVHPNDFAGALTVPSQGCTPEIPCSMCEGDCDTDDDCAGDLVCIQKDGEGTVDGCTGISYSRTDFCGAK